MSPGNEKTNVIIIRVFYSRGNEDMKFRNKPKYKQVSKKAYDCKVIHSHICVEFISEQVDFIMERFKIKLIQKVSFHMILSALANVTI